MTGLNAAVPTGKHHPAHPASHSAPPFSLSTRVRLRSAGAATVQALHTCAGRAAAAASQPVQGCESSAAPGGMLCAVGHPPPPP